MRKETQKRAERRLKIIEGQIRGLQKMVTSESYCIDIITQTSAVRSALSSVESLILENHLEEHTQHQIKGTQSKKAIKEILDVYKLAKRK